MAGAVRARPLHSVAIRRAVGVHRPEPDGRTRYFAADGDGVGESVGPGVP